MEHHEIDNSALKLQPQQQKGKNVLTQVQMTLELTEVT